LLTSASGGGAPSASLAYDPQKRLYQVAGASTTRFAYDGVKPIAEYDGSNALLRRYVFGNGHDDPIVWYEGSGTTDRRFMSRDERGSVISLTDSAGALIANDRYDEYGRPQSSNAGRFQYTGQMWLSEIGAYNYKARVYLPHLGIFAQTDPAGYDPSPNSYAYASNDPVNGSDPSGLCTGSRISAACHAYADGPGGIAGGMSGWSSSGFGTDFRAELNPRAYGLDTGAAGDAGAINVTASSSGHWVCTNCGQGAQPGPNGEIVVTANHYVWVSGQAAGGNFGLSDSGEWFGCGGANFFFGGGICRSSGRTYGYIGLQYPPGADWSVGRIYGGSENFINGVSIAGYGLPGGGISFGPGGELSAVSFQSGSPGGGITYGFDLRQIGAGWNQSLGAVNRGFNNFISVFSNGFYDLAGRPYDPR
jgi:RHS repeat-associated protein